jgi:hypothetical protein
MKQFFSKKWVFLSSIIASAVFVIGLLIMVCVPQFYIGSYKATAVEDGVEMTGTYKFKSSNKIVISMQYADESEEDVEYEAWYLRVGRKILVLGPTERYTEEEYKAAVKDFEEASEAQKEMALKYSPEINLFRMAFPYEESDNLVNGAGVAFFVIDLALALVSLAGAGYATWLYLQNKKATPTAEEAEAPAEEAAE